MAESEVDQSILIKFAQKLAGNEKKYRDLAMKKLRKWLSAKSKSSKDGMSRQDLVKIWKGLHYCMWMSDQPHIQEELARSIAGLIHCLPTFQQSMMFVDTFFETECREWFGIDRFRLDKFMMLIRQVLRHALALIKSHKWKKSYIKQLTSILQRSIITSDSKSYIPDGLRYHMADMYIGELTHADVKMSTARVHMFLEPYCVILTKIRVDKLFHHIVSRVFLEMIEWEVEKTDIDWQNEQRKENGEDEDEDIPEHIQVNYSKLADRLFELASNKNCPPKNRANIYNLIKKLRDTVEGILPRRLTFDDVGPQDMSTKEINVAARDMMQFEMNIEKSTRKAHNKHLKKLKRKRAAKLEESTLNEASEPVAKKRKSSSSEEGSPSGDKENKNDEEQTIQSNLELKINELGNNTKHKNDLIEDNGKDIVETLSKKQKKAKRKSLSNQVEAKEMLEDTQNVQANEKSSSPKLTKKHKRRSDIGVISQDSEGTAVNVDNLCVPENGVVAEQPQTPSEKKKHKRISEIGTSPVNEENCGNLQNGSTTKASRKKRRKNSMDDSQKNDELKQINPNSNISVATDVATTPDNANIDVTSQNDPVSKPNHLISSKSPKQHKSKDPSDSVNRKNKKNLGSSAMKLDKDESLLFQGGFDSDSDTDVTTSVAQVVVNTGNQAKKPNSLTNTDVASTGKSKRRKSDGNLVSFTKLTKTPPAFVKRALSKISTPLTEPRKSSVQLITPQAPGSLSSLSKKKVNFNMKRNQAQEFKASLQVSPMVPFDPQQKPEQSILRTPPILTPRTKLFKKRAKAADFF